MLSDPAVLKVEQEVAEVGHHFEVTSIPRHAIDPVRHDLFEPL